MVAYSLPRAPSHQPPLVLTGIAFVYLTEPSALPTTQAKGREGAGGGQRSRESPRTWLRFGLGGQCGLHLDAASPLAPSSGSLADRALRAKEVRDLCLHCPGVGRLSWRAAQVLR